MGTTFFYTQNYGGKTIAFAGSINELAEGLGLAVVSVGEWNQDGAQGNWEFFNEAVMSNGATAYGQTDRNEVEYWRLQID